MGRMKDADHSCVLCGSKWHMPKVYYIHDKRMGGKYHCRRGNLPPRRATGRCLVR